MSPSWRGGVTKDSLGYLRDNPSKGYQHRVVMERTLGRKLLSTEIVHHKDHNKTNNHPDNLCVMTRAEHLKHHWEEVRGSRK